MKLQPLAAMLLLLGGLACLSSVYSRVDIANVFAASPTLERTSPQAAQWQYTLLQAPIFRGHDGNVNHNGSSSVPEYDTAVEQFEYLGKEGWELVTVSNGIAIFKRPR